MFNFECLFRAYEDLLTDTTTPKKTELEFSSQMGVGEGKAVGRRALKSARALSSFPQITVYLVSSVESLFFFI